MTLRHRGDAFEPDTRLVTNPDVDVCVVGAGPQALSTSARSARSTENTSSSSAVASPQATSRSAPEAEERP